MANKTFGFDEIQKELVSIAEKEAPNKIDNQVERMQVMLLADVKLNSPVGRTGNLKERWTKSKVKDGKGEVSNPVKYAPYVEHGYVHANGGYKVPGRHMLEKALEQLDNRMASEMNQFFDDLFKEFKL